MATQPDYSVFTVIAKGDDRQADFSEVRRAIPILMLPGERHEIRSLPGGGCRVVSSDDVDGAVKAIGELDGTLYFSLNPIGPDATRAKVSTVTARRWLLIDVDPVRPADFSSTDVEKAEAAKVVDAVLEGLGGLGWPEPIVADSGNGWHVLYRLDLPNDKLAHAIIKRLLGWLSATYSTPGAKIDTSVHDAARICKLPGSWSRKGADTPERPHRRAAVLFVPEVVEVVAVEQLQGLGAESGKAAAGSSQPAPFDPFTITASSRTTSLAAYVATAITRECVAVSLAPEGERNNRLNVAAFNLGTMAGWAEMDGVAAVGALQRAAESIGLSDHEIRLTLRSGWEAGKANPREKPVDQAAKAQAEVETAVKAGKSPVKYGSTIVPRKIEWLWPGRIPLGKLTTFAGHGGLGKTFVLCDLASRITSGGEWPNAGGECSAPGDVLFISGEDDEDDTLVPRLIECGADLTRLAFLSDDFADKFSLVNLAVMKAAVEAMKDVRLIVIDPPTNYLEGVDDHKNAELRSKVLRPLARFARDHRVAIVLNNHVNKSSGKDVEAACRVMGSVAWVNGVRTAYLFVRNEADPEKVVIAPIKINIGKMPPAVTYRIAESVDSSGSPTGMAHVEWLEEQAQNADQVSRISGAGAKAAEWLTDLFRTQREWASDEINRLAKQVGVSRRALYESAEVAALPILKRKRTPPGGKTNWFWLADVGWPEDVGAEARVNPPRATATTPDSPPTDSSLLGQILKNL